MIELATVIRELRRQLIAARAEAEDEDFRMELGPIELETNVVVTREDDGAAKIRFWVVELGGNTKDVESSTQRIKLTLQPTIAGSEIRPWVSGESEYRER